jgi:hypothetical protein
MTSIRQRVEGALRRIAAGAGPEEVFAIARGHTAGEPVLWQESIAFERGRLQSYRRLRSLVDEGGAPIGTWATVAEDWRVEPLARALCDVAFWDRVADAELEPGAAVVGWSCVTAAGVLELAVPAASATVRELAGLDLELRRVANAVEASRFGAGLVCALQVLPGEGETRLRVVLVNGGNRPCLLPGPVIGQRSRLDFFRIEAAPVPTPEPGVTVADAQFRPLPLEPPAGGLPPPWSDDYLLLAPGQPLAYPIQPVLRLPEPGPHILRAVYSSYGAVEEIAGVPVIRGRVFSNELVLGA